MSRTHNVIKGDTMWDISQKYYGTHQKWPNIVKANPQLEGSARIYPGQILLIPDEIENITNPTQQSTVPESIQNVSENAISILIDDNLFSYFTDYSMTFEIDTFDTFSFSAPFDESIFNYRESFRPFSYKSVAIYYGKNLILTGVLLAPESSASPEKKEVLIRGYSKPGILNDCMMPISSFPLEFNNQTLEQITPVLCKPYGLKYKFLSPSGNPFEKVSIDIDKNIFSFLSGLSIQKGLLLSNNNQGNLIFWKSGTGNSIASFKEGELPFISCNPLFNYQSLFSHITGITSTTETKDSVKYTYENKYLSKMGILRNYNFIAEDSKDSEIKQVVLSKAGQMFGDCVSYQLSVQGHRDRNGNLYEKNKLISLHSPNAMIYNETILLIKSLTMSHATTGDTTSFNLVLPGSYTGVIQEVFPWEE